MCRVLQDKLNSDSSDTQTNTSNIVLVLLVITTQENLSYYTIHIVFVEKFLLFNMSNYTADSQLTVTNVLHIPN